MSLTQTRMLRRMLLSLPLSLCPLASASAEPPAESPATAPTTSPATLPATGPSAEVEALIGRLSSDDWRDRQRAEDQLVKLGEDAVPALRKASADAPVAEQRTRAAVALGRIEQISANGPTLVTLHFENANPKLIIAELTRQSGAPIKVWPDQIWDGKWGQKAPSVTINVDKKPFWLAMEDLCEKAGVRPQEMGFGQDITLMQGGAFGPNGPQSVSGQFLTVAVAAQRNRSVQFDPNRTRQNSDWLTLQVYADPKAKLVSYNADPEVTEATDDKGNSLGTHKAAANAAGGDLMHQRPFTFTMSVPLTYPDDGYTKLSRLRGSFSVLLASKTETLEIPDLEKSLNVPKAIAGRTVKFTKVKLTDHSLTYSLHIHRAGLAAAQWQNLFSDVRRMKITDANGNTFSGGGGGGSDDNDADVENGCSTSATLKGPLKLVWELTTETKEESIPFEFKDLPLPTP